MEASPTPASIGPLLPGGDDTIVALATAPGRGALAVIRLSGRRAFEIAGMLVDPWPPLPRRVTLSDIRDAHGVPGTLLDRALVIRYESPHSYTGEDLVEFTTHGGVLVPSTIIGALIDQGARQAHPGEFTRRAFENGRIDLTEARSRRGQTAALTQLDGGLSRRIDELRRALIEIEALIAYDIDFPEEDDGPIPSARIIAATDTVLAGLSALRATAEAGELVREGAVIVLAGAPNVGKSSLFNALLGQSRAIVTDIPGTTRDALEAVIDAGTWALRLVDTAGLRVTTDRVEQMGIEMSERYLDRAAAVLACGDTPESIESVVRSIRQRTEAPIIVVRTKADLIPAQPTPSDLLSNSYQRPGSSNALPAIAVSAETGAGLDGLIARIVEVLSSRHADLPLDAPLLTRVRHQRAVEEARNEVTRFRSAWQDEKLPAPVAATHLRNAVIALEEMIGIVGIDDVLDRLFTTFCVGK